MKIYTIHDSKAESYGQPFFARQNGEAIRTFSAAVNDASSQFNKYTSDFTLFEIGEFDEQTGVINALVPHALGNGVDFKEVK